MGTLQGGLLLLLLLLLLFKCLAKVNPNPNLIIQVPYVVPLEVK